MATNIVTVKTLRLLTHCARTELDVRTALAQATINDPMKTQFQKSDAVAAVGIARGAYGILRSLLSATEDGPMAEGSLDHEVIISVFKRYLDALES